MSEFKIINGSCAMQNVVAIVNAANRYLMSGGGICGVIFKMAGYDELIGECRKIKVPLNDGDAVITSSCNIKNCKYIIHAVGPDFGKTPEAFDKLYAAYYNSLFLFMENELHSISFPLISAGIFGYSLDNPALVSAEMCFKAYNDFIKTYNDYFINVLLCAYTTNEYNECLKILNRK